MFVLSKRLYINRDIDLEKHQLERFISFLWTRMDHFLDSVRHLARDTMIHLVKIKGNLIHMCFIIKKNSNSIILYLLISSYEIQLLLFIYFIISY